MQGCQTAAPQLASPYRFAKSGRVLRTSVKGSAP